MRVRAANRLGEQRADGLANGMRELVQWGTHSTDLVRWWEEERRWGGTNDSTQLCGEREGEGEAGGEGSDQ